MDHVTLLVTLLVIGAPLALFFSLRRRAHTSAEPERRTGGDAEAPGPAKDFGMERESSTAPGTPAESDTPSTSTAAAAAAAGGALILAVGAARHHASEGGGESPQAHGDTPDSGASGDGGGGDGGDGGGGGGGD